jgi:hypothetical protein
MAGAHRVGTPVSQILATLRREREQAEDRVVLPGPITDAVRIAAAAGGVEVNPERGLEPDTHADHDGHRLTGRAESAGRAWFRIGVRHAAA